MTWTLRDLRRLVRSGRVGLSADGERLVAMDRAGRYSAAGWPLAESARCGTAAQVLDRLVGIHGARFELPSQAAVFFGRARPLGEERPKENHEVAPQGADQNKKSRHGGDGNSGEVKAEADTAADSARTDAAQGAPAGGSPGDGEGGPGTTDESPQQANPAAPAAAGQIGEDVGAGGVGYTSATDGGSDDFRDDDIPGELTSEADRSPDEIAAAQMACRADPGESASSGTGRGRPSGDPKKSESGGDGSPSAGPRDEYGGQHATLKEAQAGLRDPMQRRAARRLARRLDQLFAGWSVGGLDESPRVDPRRLIKHLVSKRGQLGRCVRREVDERHELIILAADVSGSCSAIAEDTTAAIAQVAEHDDRVLLVIHSNGMPLEVQGGPAGLRVAPAVELGRGSFDAQSETYAGALPWWREVIQRHRIVGTVALGDWDAARVYRELAQLAPLVWLDSYSKRSGVRDRTRQRLRDWQGDVRYITGVGDAATADAALALLCSS